MAEKDLETLTNVNFPHTVVAEEIEALMGHVALDLQCGVEYMEKVVKKVGELDGQVQGSREVIGVSGAIVIPRLAGTLHFSAKREIVENGSRYSGLKIHTTPGYEVEELPPVEIEFMEKLARSTRSYFESNRVRKKD